MARTLEVQFIGDTRSLDRAFKKVDKGGKGLKGSFVGLAGGAKALAGGAALGAVALGIKDATGAFYESNKISKQTKAVLKSTGGQAKVSAKHVGDLATAISKKTGIDDEAIQSTENLLLTFKNIRNEAGKGNKIFDQSTKAVTDMSVALGQDGKTSAIQLGKALNDPIKGITSLQRVGVSFTEKQKEQIKGLVDHGKKLEAQKMILKEINSEFGGSAKAQATNMDKLKVTLGNLQESIGSVFVPIIEKATGFLNKFIDGMMSGSGAGGRLVQALKDAGEWLSGAFSSAVSYVSGLLEKHRDDIKNVTDAITNIGAAIKYAWEEVGLPIVKRVVPAIKQIIKGAFDVIGGIIKTISSVLTGRWGDAWDGVKQIFKGGIEIVFGQLRAMTAPIREIASKIGGAIIGKLSDAWGTVKHGVSDVVGAITGKFSDAWSTVKSGVSDIVGWFRDRFDTFKDVATKMAKPFVGAFDKIGDGVKVVIDFIDDLFDKVKTVIDLIGKIHIPHISLPFIGGGKGNGSSVGPAPTGVDGFTPIASQFGLMMTSGFRPGDPGWHGKNRARDYSNGVATRQELAFAQSIAAAYGPRLLELIHTPLGYGIKNGKRVPLSFWGPEVNAEHYNHVHVAMRRGGKVPGSGPGDRVPALLEPGEFVVRKAIVDRFGPTFFAGINGMKSGGIVEAARAAKAAGWRGTNLVRAVAIAGAESSYNRRAHALTSLEDSRGMWQVNVRAHPWASRLNLYNPTVGARAAHRVWEEAGGSFGPWTTWPGRASAYMARARKAVASLTKGKGKGKGKSKSSGRHSVSTGTFEPFPIASGIPSMPDPGPPEILAPISSSSGGAGDSGSTSTTDTGAAALAAELKRMNDFNDWLINTQGPTLVGAVVAAVNGGIGGKVGLGFQGIRSPVGSVAGL